MTLRAILCSGHSCYDAHVGNVRPWGLDSYCMLPVCHSHFSRRAPQDSVFSCRQNIWTGNLGWGGHSESHEDKWMAGIGGWEWRKLPGL